MFFKSHNELMLSFSTLSTSDASRIQKYVSKFEPYSDFNFVSLYSWSLSSKTKFCSQKGCLFLILPDYITQEDSYTFLCGKKVGRSLQLYIDWVKNNSGSLVFKFLPEQVANDAVKYLKKNGMDYELIEDRDSFDYILNVEDLWRLKGKGYADFRYKLSLFERLWGGEVSEFYFDSSDKIHTRKVMDLAKKWVKQKNGNNLYNEELEAIDRFLDVSKDNKNIRFKAYSYNSEIIAWASYELVGKTYAMGHFLKYDSRYKGIYNKLVHAVCADLAGNKTKFLNIEQDLGIESLRRAKMHLKPATFLKKYELVVKQ